MRQQAVQRLPAKLQTAACQCRFWRYGTWEWAREARRAATMRPKAVTCRLRCTCSVVAGATAATAAAAATASSGAGAQESAQQPDSSHPLQHREHGRQPLPVRPRLGRQLWQLLSPDWVRLLCVAAFTLLSVVCTVSIGPAVGRGPRPRIACLQCLSCCWKRGCACSRFAASGSYATSMSSPIGGCSD